MRKLLLVGKFTEHFREVNKRLTDKYEVRACVNKLEIFKGMFKLNKPDIVVLLLNELDETNGELLKELKEEYRQIPVVCAGIKLDNSLNYKVPLSKQFEYMEESYTVESLIKKIEDALEKDISEDENFEVSESDKKNVPEEKKEDNKEENKGIEGEGIKEEKILEREDRRKTILLVDDSGIFLRMMKSLLEENYDVKMATSGLKAISLIHEKHPDLILLDYEMPLYDGRETMIKIRESEKTKDIPIVFVTAVNDKEHIKAVLSLKPAGYLLKPLDKERLLQTVKEIIG